jgi:NADH:ubiquinone oxidoreductase subunit 5 (subunit L)/multisubunit Na+/H+ antiporter MnhA subunit
MMLNRIGDVGLALGIMTLFYVSKNNQIMKPFSYASMFEWVSQSHGQLRIIIY